jgi:hypothetical protein
LVVADPRNSCVHVLTRTETGVCNCKGDTPTATISSMIVLVLGATLILVYRNRRGADLCLQNSYVVSLPLVSD